ncbi:heat shock protein [Bartonella australis AUST/NH1]|uniref:Heat shock protein n=1 Tax=Bartonella australis (strain Aust/NH1) TaxID=1094489 RepID=M1P3Q0_BARAA|nr:Hsp20 family protein [Bartonella australis]AGF74450.1 heat shock protein [Bartonella australis AUST/NH1]
MRQVDFSPFYRSTVGFDHLFNWFDSRTQPDDVSSYPPYNIERLGEDSYRISMAVAGFSQDAIDIETHCNQLTIKGEKTLEENDEGREFLYRGIASRAFERRFHLADHVKVVGAELSDGLLHIQLKREMPAELKPKKIVVQTLPSAAKKAEGRSVSEEIAGSKKN